MVTAASCPPSARPPKIQRRTLRGHRGPVLCLAHSSERPPPPSRGRLLPRDHDDDAYHHHHHGHHPSLLLSGSEDGTARLWYLRTRQTSVCMVVPRGDAGGGGDGDDYDAGVSCVAFHPSIGEGGGDDGGYSGGDGPASSTIHLGEYAAYVSSGNRVYGYDLRRHVDVASMTTTTTTTTSTPPMIIRAPHYDLTDDFGCADEINELSFSHPRRGGRNAYILSAADDSGEVRVVEDPRFRGERRESRTGTTVLRLLHADPGTSAIATCVTFRPKSHDGGGGGRGNGAHSYLATAGTDCAVKLWDAGDGRRSRRPTSIATIGPRRVDDPSSSSSIRLCNPPYVHSLSWSPSGRLLAAGVGDGSVTVYRAEGHRLVGVGRFGDEVGGHASAVAAVRFADFAPSAAATDRRRWGRTEMGDRLLVSAGNEGNLIFWDLGRDVAGRGPSDPRPYLGCPALPEIQTSIGGDGRHLDDIPGMAEMGAATSSSPGVLFQMEHRHKRSRAAVRKTIAPRMVTVTCAILNGQFSYMISMP